MGKLAQATSKYTIVVKFEAEGTVEKPDVIGAVFGQTEGLLGPDMDLRELQKTGRIGRIDVELSTVSGKTHGKVIIPSSLDSSETALIGACMETIERVGPCNAKIYIEKIEDVRIEKRKYVIGRAKELLAKMIEEGAPEAQELTEQIKQAVRSEEITSYQGLPAGPNLEMYDSIIIVEGRADVLNLLRCGIKNVIAIEGTSVPQSIIELSKRKLATVFLDGDRGGDLILKELTAVCEIENVARASFGKEVEELTKKEIFKALREQVPLNQVKSELKQLEKENHNIIKKREFKPKLRIDRNQAKLFKDTLTQLTGTRAAYLLDSSGEILGKVPIKEMFNAIKEIPAQSIVFDGEIDQRLIGFCSQNGIKNIIGMKISGRISTPESIQVLTMGNL